MTIKYPDYQDSIVNLACSILKHYGAEYNHPSLPVFDRLLSGNYKNVVVLLFDGMGVDALGHHLPEDSFLRQHVIQGISSVFPPTTTAATTSIESGLTPAEHGWIGWSLYFRELDKIVNIFLNTEKFSKNQAADYHVAGTILPYDNIFDRINQTGNAKAYSISPYHTNKVSSLDGLFQEVKGLCAQEGRKYIYSYWEEPDMTMHRNGCYDASVTKLICDINRRVERLCCELQDTLVIVTADHGHINLKHHIVSDYPQLMNMLERPITIESRAACFYVRKEFRDQFAEEFHKAFGDAFLLLSKKEILEQKLFGDGKPHPKFEELIGDFIAVATADKGIVYNQESRQYASNHAGLTEQEMMVPFIAIMIPGNPAMDFSRHL